MDGSYSMIFTVVNKGYSDQVMEAAREAGAKGGTIINARGTGKMESDAFMGMEIHPEKEIVLIIAESALRHNIMVAIYKEVGLETEGSGFSFSMPIDEIIGTAKLSCND